MLSASIIASEPTKVQPQERLSIAISNNDTQAIRQVLKTTTPDREHLDSLADTLLSSLDPNFNPSKSPEMSVQPPSGWKSAGTDPNGIVDPKEREKYEESIKLLNDTLAKHATQRAIYETLVAVLDVRYANSNPNGSVAKTSQRDLILLKAYVSENSNTEAHWEIITKWHDLLNRQEANRVPVTDY